MGCLRSIFSSNTKGLPPAVAEGISIGPRERWNRMRKKPKAELTSTMGTTQAIRLITGTSRAIDKAGNHFRLDDNDSRLD